MAEIDVAGIKIKGGKLLILLPIIGTILGGLWGGFELFSRYQQMEQKINEYVAPDLSEFDKNLALVTEEINLFKEEIQIIKESITETVGYARDMKHSMRDDLTRIEKIVDQVEDDVKKVETDEREMKILGINGLNHDAALTLLQDGEVLFVDEID